MILFFKNDCNCDLIFLKMTVTVILFLKMTVTVILFF